MIGGIGDPEGCYWYIGLKHGPDLDGADGEVILKKIMGFNTILDKEVVAFDIISYVFLDCKIVDSVEGDYSGHWVMYGISSCEWLGYVAVHVEMDAISSDYSWLPAFSELSVCDLPD